MSEIAANIQYVEEKIMDACEKSGRNKDDVTLICVTKTKPFDMLMEAYHAGQRDFGENKVQELVDKYEKAPKDSRFHLIGHLQTNKAKYIVDKVFLIHSVDSFELAEKISKEALKKQVEVNILIEVNVAEEPTKFGVKLNEALPLIKKIAALEAIHIKGLMTIAPYVQNPEENRQYFVALKQLSVDIKKENIDNVSVDILSMGMTGDYCIAVEEGATYVRVGTGIFGERN